MCAVINATTDLYDHTIVSLDRQTEAVRWLSGTQVGLVDFWKSPRRWTFFRDLYRVIRTEQPHVLMTYNWGATDAIWLGRLAGLSTIIHHEHGFNIDEARGLSWRRDLIRRGVYRLASTTVVVSHTLLQMMRTTFALKDQKVVLIPNGIDAGFYTQDGTARERMRTALGCHAADFVIGFAGRLDPVKNFDLLLHCVAACVRQEKHVKLLVVGDGPERPRIAALCQALQIQDHVMLVGQTADVLPYLRACDAFVLTSYSEQMPMTILEAMAVGLPVVASQVGEIPYIIEDGVNGFLLSPAASPATWAQVVLALYRGSTCQAIGQAARHTVQAQYQETAMVQQYQQLIARLLPH